MIGERNEYPYVPPFDDEVTFFEQATVRLNPQGFNKKAKICPICNYPIHIRMVSYPCQHYFCNQCYQKNTFTCGFCGSLNSKITRLQDDDSLYSCDLYCSKAFESEQKLNEHLQYHKLLQQQ